MRHEHGTVSEAFVRRLRVRSATNDLEVSVARVTRPEYTTALHLVRLAFAIDQDPNSRFDLFLGPLRLWWNVDTRLRTERTEDSAVSHHAGTIGDVSKPGSGQRNQVPVLS